MVKTKPGGRRAAQHDVLRQHRRRYVSGLPLCYSSAPCSPDAQKIAMSSELHAAFPAHRFSIAPMLDWTDRHCRYFLRLLSRQTLLYTEMVTTGAIIHGKGDYLAYSDEEHPVALQLGEAIRLSLRSVQNLRRLAAMTRSTLTSAVRRIACRTVCLAHA